MGLEKKRVKKVNEYIHHLYVQKRFFKWFKNTQIYLIRGMWNIVKPQWIIQGYEKKVFFENLRNYRIMNNW